MIQKPGYGFITLVLGGLFWFATPASAADTILILHNKNIAMPAKSVFREAMEGIYENLEGTVNVFEFPLLEETSLEETRIYLDVVNPDLVILMGNQAIHKYRIYQIFSGRHIFPPAVVLMEVFVQRDVERLTNAVGIEYQVQAVTSLNHFRNVFPGTKRVGVIYRNETAEFFLEQQKQCREEKVELVGIEVGKNHQVTPRAVRRALKRLAQREKVQAIWILNDNVLLTSKILREAWMRSLGRYDLPTIVGIRRFFAEEEFANLGHFAVVPEPHGVGMQAADLVLAIRANGWKILETKIYPPISIQKFLNRRKLPHSLSATLDSDKLLELDKVLE